jgi:hypothetical protein
LIIDGGQRQQAEDGCPDEEQEALLDGHGRFVRLE